MGKKQTQELKRRVLSQFPKRSKIKHYRHGGYNNMKTMVHVVSEAGNDLESFSGADLESALREYLQNSLIQKD